MLHEAISVPYVDYEYYHQTFLGTIIPAASFPQKEKKAEAFVNRITFGRVKLLREVPSEVKNAICAVAEYDYQCDKKTPGAKSENIDGFSISYGDSTEASKNTERYGAAKDYLSDTGLLYRGRSWRYDNQR